MSDLPTAIKDMRDGVVALLRVHPETRSESPEGTGTASCTFGTGFCVARDRLVLTARHVLAPTGELQTVDRFYALAVPGNGERAYHFSVTRCVLDRPDLDLAVLELGQPATPGVSIPALPMSFDAVPDGTRAMTIGFPAPEIADINIDERLEFHGGRLFLKSHANEGIVAAQYRFNDEHMYELNVGWHHGESGGPIARVDGDVAVFSVMQHYRNVQTPHGIVAGPHRAFSLAAIRAELMGLGVERVI